MNKKILAYSKLAQVKGQRFHSASSQQFICSQWILCDSNSYFPVLKFHPLSVY